MNLKPGDFLFGIVDFLAFLVPGVIFLVTLPEVVGIVFPEQVGGSAAESDTINVLLFIVLSYVFGHFIHHLGALTLNPVYKYTYFKGKIKKHADFIQHAEKSIERMLPQHSNPVRAADGYIRCYQPSLIPELDKHEANSKLFRALALLCLYLCFYTHTLVPWQVPLLLMLSLLSYSRFANQRWKRQLLTYEFFTILNYKGQGENDKG